MNNHSFPINRVKVKLRPSASIGSFIKFINKLASRDKFSPLEEVQQTQKKNINRGRLIKLCTQCRKRLVPGENITQYRYNKYNYLCACCYSEWHKSFNKKRAPTKDLNSIIQKKKVSLQKRITKLMEQLAYINAMDIKLPISK
jgi:hypothetical protein